MLSGVTQTHPPKWEWISEPLVILELKDYMKVWITNVRHGYSFSLTLGIYFKYLFNGSWHFLLRASHCHPANRDDLHQLGVLLNESYFIDTSMMNRLEWHPNLDLFAQENIQGLVTHRARRLYKVLILLYILKLMNCNYINNATLMKCNPVTIPTNKHQINLRLC